MLTILEQAPSVMRIVVMVQREVGERFAATPGQEGYGAVSVRVAYRAAASIVRRVPASVFWPRPKVASVVVRFDRLDAPPVDAEPERLWRVVDAGFAERRKTMRNALRRLGLDLAAADAVLASCGVASTARAEELDLATFAAIGGGAPEVSDREITRRAYAKLNVSLRVIGARDDGFHEIESLVLPVSLYDLVTVHSSDRLTLSVSGEAAAAVPADETNLALVAARALADALDREPAGAIAIDKRIPVAAGLGGGSADAAATLLALRELWDVEIDDETIVAVAASVGLRRPGAPRRVGRDDDRTRRADRAGAAPRRPGGPFCRSRSRSGWPTPTRGGTSTASPAPSREDLLEVVASGAPESLATVLSNDLQAPVVVAAPEIGEAIDAFVAAGAVAAQMSGSGPTVVALAWNEAHAERLVDAVQGAFVVTGPPEPGVA